MKYAVVALCALFVACDDGGSDQMVDGDGTLGVAVEDLSKWGLDACPVGLEEVDGVCVAGTVDMQLDIDDCVVISKCLPGKYSCARAAVVGLLDLAADSDLPSLTWPREVGATAEFANYLTYFYRDGVSDESPESGLEHIRGRRDDFDSDGTTECLIGLEGDIVQDHWKWSRVRAQATE